MSNTCLLYILIGGVLFQLLAGKCSSQLTAGDCETLVPIRKGVRNPRQLVSWDPAVAAADYCSWVGVMCSSNTSIGQDGGRVVTGMS
uniref:Leucine-rich repeat-containing N-terminal plant-type domain-containing protein n=2 Tax=Oryza TaxID=4527 RepID=A0A0D3GHU0_9ORYZ